MSKKGIIKMNIFMSGLEKIFSLQTSIMHWRMVTKAHNYYLEYYITRSCIIWYSPVVQNKISHTVTV